MRGDLGPRMARLLRRLRTIDATRQELDNAHMDSHPSEGQHRRPLELSSQHIGGAAVHANRYELMRALRPYIEGKTVAEVGVAFGHFSRFVIDQLQPRKFDAYDVFEMHTWPHCWGEPPAVALKGMTHEDFYRDRFFNEINAGMVSIIKGDGAESLQRSSYVYDLIYIDADHRYDGVKRDAAAAISCLKEGGVIVFNDYIVYDHLGNQEYGVVQVVNELCVNDGWRITDIGWNYEMFIDVAIQRCADQLQKI